LSGNDVQIIGSSYNDVNKKLSPRLPEDRHFGYI